MMGGSNPMQPTTDFTRLPPAAAQIAEAVAKADAAFNKKGDVQDGKAKLIPAEKAFVEPHEAAQEAKARVKALETEAGALEAKALGFREQEARLKAWVESSLEPTLHNLASQPRDGVHPDERGGVHAVRIDYRAMIINGRTVRGRE